MNRLQQKYALFHKLGRLFGPLQHLIENPDLYDEQEKAETLAQYFAEYPVLQNDFTQFSLAEPGRNYKIESTNFSISLGSLDRDLRHGKRLEEILEAHLAKAQAAIDAIPIPRTSVILEAGSPFTTYCRLKELCEIDATRSLVWLDPYMGSNLFHRYISNVRKQTCVTLVTSEPALHASRKDKARWDEFIDISRLYAQESGPTIYRLVIQPTLHDRWVIFDDKRIYSLGGSAKDAGIKDYFTIASLESSVDNLQRIQRLINTGIEWFGPSTPIHS